MTTPPKVERLWAPPSPLGYHSAMQSAGGVAAPLLAGFSFTMTSVLLISPNVCRWQNATLALFVAAGLFLIFAVQTSLWLQSYAVRPTDFQEWLPNKFADGTPSSDLFSKHQDYATRADQYARWTRRLYNLGITTLLAAVTTAALPPGRIPNPRLVVVAIGAVGLLAELAWIWHSRVRRS